MADSGVRLKELLVALSWPLTSGSASRPSTCSARRASPCAWASGSGLEPDRAGHALRRKRPHLRRVSRLRQRGVRCFSATTSTSGPTLWRSTSPGSRPWSSCFGGPATAPRRSTGPARLRRLMATGGRGMIEQMANHCSAAGVLADRLGLGADGPGRNRAGLCPLGRQGRTRGLAGDGLALSARISHVAEACEVFQRTAGVDAAVDMVRSRSGAHFDPEWSTPSCRGTPVLFDGIAEDTVDEIARRRARRPPVSERDELERVGGVGRLLRPALPLLRRARPGDSRAGGPAAELMRMPSTEDDRLTRRPHSFTTSGASACRGRCGTSPARSPPATRSECGCTSTTSNGSSAGPERSEEIGLLAATHHERMDGSGYHRG